MSLTISNEFIFINCFTKSLNKTDRKKIIETIQQNREKKEFENINRNNNTVECSAKV